MSLMMFACSEISDICWNLRTLSVCKQAHIVRLCKTISSSVKTALENWLLIIYFARIYLRVKLQIFSYALKLCKMCNFSCHTTRYMHFCLINYQFLENFPEANVALKRKLEHTVFCPVWARKTRYVYWLCIV